MFTRRALCLVSSVFFIACASSTPSGEAPSDHSASTGDGAAAKSSGAVCNGDTTHDSEVMVSNAAKFPAMSLTVDDETYKLTCACNLRSEPGGGGTVRVIRPQDNQKIGEFFLENGVVGRRLVVFKDGHGKRVTAPIDLKKIHAEYEKAGGTCYGIHPGLKTYDFAPG